MHTVPTLTCTIHRIAAMRSSGGPSVLLMMPQFLPVSEPERSGGAEGLTRRLPV